MNNKHLFLTVLEAVKSKIMVSTDLVSCESRLPHQGHLLAVRSHDGRSSQVSFTRALDPVRRAPPSGTDCLPMATPPNTIFWG